MSKLLNVDEAAEMLGIAARTLRELAYERQISCVKIGKLYRFKPEHLEAFIRRREQSAMREMRSPG